MLTLTVSLAQVAYLSACGGFILGVLALWAFVEIWKLIARPAGRHRLPRNHRAVPLRHVYVMTTGVRIAVIRPAGYV